MCVIPQSRVNLAAEAKQLHPWFGKRGGKAQRNADIHLLVGSPNLSLGHFMVLGRRANAKQQVSSALSHLALFHFHFYHCCITFFLICPANIIYLPHFCFVFFSTISHWSASSLVISSPIFTSFSPLKAALKSQLYFS